MRVLVTALGQLLMIVSWVFGIAAASGALSTFFALIFPPWAWVVLAERALTAWGWA